MTKLTTEPWKQEPEVVTWPEPGSTTKNPQNGYAGGGEQYKTTP